MTYYKLANPQGWDFYTGKTLNFRDSIGGIVTAPDWIANNECGGGIHYSSTPLAALRFAKIPCSAYEVEPVGRNHRKIDGKKSKAQSLRVVREVTDLDALFGFSYAEAAHPIQPCKLTPPAITEEVLAMLRFWDSVRESMGGSVWESVRDSMGGSVWESVWDSAWESVWESAWESVWESVWESAWAYIGSLFPNITIWKCITHEPGIYPFQAGADLWRMGLVPSFDRRIRIWYLHGYEDARVLWQGTP